MNFEKTINSLAASVRYGFATNSSSSHSILLTSDMAASTQGADEAGRYGWGWFQLADAESKADYLWTNVFGQLRGKMRRYDGFSKYSPDFLSRTQGVELPDIDAVKNTYAANLTSALLGYEPSFKFDASDEPYIDHQSCFSLPINEDSLLPHKEFTDWFKQLILTPGTIIYGGNDNDDSGVTGRAPGTDLLDQSRLGRDEHVRARLCRERDDHFLLFDKGTGWKARVPKTLGAEIPFSSYPELIDIKITDHCTMGCKYCYQGSTPQGKHADFDSYHLGTLLKEMQVLEVAIGGGEPLTSPHLSSLLYTLNDHGICANITTRRLDLLSPLYLKQLTQIGYSVDTVVAAAKAIKQAKDGGWVKKLTLHIVLGTMNKEDFLETLRLAQKSYVTVLLLGYKTDGFGHQFQPHPHEDWIDWIQAEFTENSTYWVGPHIGVDTAIAQKYGRVLQDKLHVDPKFMVGAEGMFSMYMDLVEGTIARASYGEEKKTKITAATKDRAAQILKEFRAWHEKPESNF